ncbi:hypothetical protein ACFLX6_00640 [Chloroflexota bacterium]
MRKWLRRIGLILGLLGAVWAAVISFGFVALQAAFGYDPVPSEAWLVGIVAGLTVIGGVAIAWKWELIGGILLIAEAPFMLLIVFFVEFLAGMGRPYYYSGGYSVGYILGQLTSEARMSAISNSPVAISGILLLLSWWIGRRQTKIPAE